MNDASMLDAMETRIWPRLLAALTEVGCAAWLAWVWLHPARAGLDGVMAAFAVVTMEGPLLFALLGLIGLVRPDATSLNIRIATMLMLVMGATVAAFVAIGATIRAPSAYMLSVVAGILVGKWMLFVDGRRNAFHFEFAKLFLQFVVLMTCLAVASDLMLPLRFDGEDVARLGIPDRLTFDAQRPGPRSPGEGISPWAVVAAGIVYFVASGALRFLTLTRPSMRKARA